MRIYDWKKHITQVFVAYFPSCPNPEYTNVKEWLSFLKKIRCVYHAFREAKDEQGENTLCTHNVFIYHQLNYRANKPLKNMICYKGFLRSFKQKLNLMTLVNQLACYDTSFIKEIYTLIYRRNKLLHSSQWGHWLGFFI